MSSPDLTTTPGDMPPILQDPPEAGDSPELVDPRVARLEFLARIVRDFTTQLQLHELRIYGRDDSAGGGIRVWCETCQQNTYLQDGHTIDELQRLAEQHSGIAS